MLLFPPFYCFEVLFENLTRTMYICKLLTRYCALVTNRGNDNREHELMSKSEYEYVIFQAIYYIGLDWLKYLVFR